MRRTASLRRSRSQTGSVASITEEETGERPHRGQRGSSFRPLPTITEGSNSRKRGRSPPEEDTATRKRTRVEISSTKAAEVAQEGTRVPGGSDENVSNEEDELSPNVGSSGQGDIGHAAMDQISAREHRGSGQGLRQVVLDKINRAHH